MTFKIVDTYHFKKEESPSNLIETKDYIIGFENGGPVFNNGKIYLFDKSMKFKRSISLKIMGYEATFARAKLGHNTLALIACNESFLHIVDLETELIKEIPFPATSEKNTLYPSKFYWWDNDILLISTLHEKYYRIDIASSEISIVDRAYIQSNFPEFYALLEYADKYFNVIDFNPLTLQFTYHNERELGFVDVRKGIVHKVLYLSKDVHSAYFYKNRFIVFGCYFIEEVTNSEAKLTHFELKRETYEYQRALLIAQTNQLSDTEFYWYGEKSDLHITSALRIKFDDTIGELSAADKERSLLYNHLKNNPTDSAAWLRLILVDYYDKNGMSGGGWNHLYSNDIYGPLISMYRSHITDQKIKKSPGLIKLLYDELLHISETNPTLVAPVELAKAWLFKEKGTMRKYKSALLKSIECAPDYVNNYIALGELYLEQGKTKKGKELLQKALANVKKVYANDSEKNWDRYNMQEFINEYYKGIYQSKEKYDELVSTLKEIV